MSYDQHYQRHAAAESKSMQWGSIQSEIWTLYFGRAKAQPHCLVCGGSGHTNCTGSSSTDEMVTLTSQFHNSNTAIDLSIANAYGYAMTNSHSLTIAPLPYASDGTGVIADYQSVPFSIHALNVMATTERSTARRPEENLELSKAEVLVAKKATKQVKTTHSKTFDTQLNHVSCSSFNSIHQYCMHHVTHKLKIIILYVLPPSLIYPIISKSL